MVLDHRNEALIRVKCNKATWTYLNLGGKVAQTVNCVHLEIRSWQPNGFL
jgi:hypothetical protein